MAKKASIIETTGKNEIIYTTFGFCPAVEKNVIVYKIVELGFTLSGKCVSIVEVFSSPNMLDAMDRYRFKVADTNDLKLVQKFTDELNKEVK